MTTLTTRNMAINRYKNRKNIIWLPFTKEVHSLLKKQDISCIANYGYVPDCDYFKGAHRQKKVYALHAMQYKTTDSNGNWHTVNMDTISVSVNIELPKEANSEVRHELLQKYPTAEKIEAILQEFGEDDNLEYRKLSWMQATEDVLDIRNVGYEFPVNSMHLEQMYIGTNVQQFYLFFDCSLQNDYLLYKKIKNNKGE